MGSKAKKVGGWRQWTEEEARVVLGELAQSGVSAAEYARAKGISTHRLAYWRKRLSDTGTPAFVAVTLPSGTAVQREQPIEIVVGGVVVRMAGEVAAERLASIVQALAKEASKC